MNHIAQRRVADGAAEIVAIYEETGGRVEPKLLAFGKIALHGSRLFPIVEALVELGAVKLQLSRLLLKIRDLQFLLGEEHVVELPELPLSAGAASRFGRL